MQRAVNFVRRRHSVDGSAEKREAAAGAPRKSFSRVQEAMVSERENWMTNNNSRHSWRNLTVLFIVSFIKIMPNVSKLYRNRAAIRAFTALVCKIRSVVISSQLHRKIRFKIPGVLRINRVSALQLLLRLHSINNCLQQVQMAVL